MKNRKGKKGIKEKGKRGEEESMQKGLKTLQVDAVRVVVKLQGELFTKYVFRLFLNHIKNKKCMIVKGRLQYYTIKKYRMSS